MNLDYSVLYQYALVPATDIYCSNIPRGHFEHLFGFLSRIENPAPHLIADLLDLAVLMLMVVLFAYGFIDHRFLSHHFFFSES